VWSSGDASRTYCEGDNGKYPWYATCCHWDGTTCAIGPPPDDECAIPPPSMNGLSYPLGCSGAVWASGDPSKFYCEGADGKYPWWATCCHWDGSACVGRTTQSTTTTQTIQSTIAPQLLAVGSPVMPTRKISLQWRSNFAHKREVAIAVWVADPWESCQNVSASCMRRRQVSCEDAEGRELELDNCDPSTEPASSKPCRCSEVTPVPPECLHEDSSFNGHPCRQWHGLDCFGNGTSDVLRANCPHACGLC